MKKDISLVKQGDAVRCTKASGTNLVKNKVYTVHSVSHNKFQVTVRAIDGWGRVNRKKWYMKNRFVKNS